jgi:outer membrane immunogenic protein
MAALQSRDNKSNRGVLMTKTALLASAGFGLLMAFALPAQANGPWTGVYLGGHAGGAWGDAAMTKTAEGGAGFVFDTEPVGSALDFSPDGVLGGLQIGYLYQFSNFVVGIEVSGSYTDLDETRLDPLDNDTNPRTVTSDWNAAATLRGGYAFGHTLAYVKGGVALARFEHALVDDFGATGTYSTTEDHEGWTAGAGLEHMLSSDVSLALEYAYYDFGGKDHVAIIGPASVTRELEAELHTVTARLNWHFNP